MDEEEELDNTLFGQEEAPAVNTGDARIGSGGTTPRPITMADANNPAFEGMSAPEIIDAVNAPGYQSPDFSIQNRDALAPERPLLLPYVSPESRGGQILDTLIDLQAKAMDIPLNIAALPFLTAKNYLLGTEDNLNPTLGEAATSAAESRDPIQNLLNPNVDETVSRQDQLVKEFLDREPRPLPSGVTDGDPNRPTITGPFSGPVDPFAPPPAVGEMTPPPAVREMTSAEASRTSTPFPDQTLSQFMRYEDNPANRTEQFVDPQGRLRLRLTEEAARLRGEPVGSQPLADRYQSYEADVADREARLRANERQPGETQSAADTRSAQSKTTGGQTSGISFDDARIEARGRLAGRGIKNPTVSQVNDLARSIQRGSVSQFQPKVVEVGGQKLIQLAPEYFQPVRPEPKADEPFVPRVLKEGGFTYYEVAPNRFEIQPSAGGQSGTSPSGDFSSIIAGVQGANSSVPKVGSETAPVKVNSQAEYDALPAGTPYIDSQGTETVKK